MLAAHELTFASALLLGFFGSVHCVGMCGGIVLAFGQPLAHLGVPRQLLYHLGYSAGRISSYALAGALAGSVGFGVAELVGPTGGWLLRVACGVLFVMVGCHLAGWWPGAIRLEALGAPLWQRISPLTRRLQPVDRFWKVLALGALWGWLPCALVYGALAAATTAGDALGGAAVMVGFGVGTLPALWATGAFAVTLSRWIARREARWLAGGLLVVFGLWTLVGAGHGGHAHPAGEAHPPSHGEHHGATSHLEGASWGRAVNRTIGPGSVERGHQRLEGGGALQ